MSVPAPPCGVLTYDDELRLLDVNPIAGAMLGAAPEALVGRSITTLLSRSAQIFFSTQVHPPLALIGHVEELYLRLLHADGTEVPVVLNGVRAVTEAGPRITLAVLPMRRRQVFEDELIRARDAAEAATRLEREAQTEIKAAHARLAMRERLAALGTLAHGIAHEINNPLTYVIANLELVADQLKRNPAAVIDPALVQDALEGTDRIREITRQIGSMARAEEAPRGRLHPHSVVALVARMTAVQTRARAKVVVELGDVPEIEGDPGRLGQVLTNLVLNAAQAFGDRSAGHNEIRVQTRTGVDGSAIIEVSDNGPGIPSDVAPRIFEPFFTTKPVGEGSGLGLPISQGFVQSLGGALTFETTVGEGTTFRITLPAAPSAVAAAAPPSRARVLVVDDDPAVARAVGRMLREYDVTVVHSAREALAHIQADARFDHVFSDLSMPEEDGLSLHAAIEGIDPGLAERMVFLTGGGHQAEETLLRRGLPTLRKPVDRAALVAWCEAHVQRRPHSP